VIDTFTRTGPLMEASSYPAWAQQLLGDCQASKRKVVEHELYQRMRDGVLSPATMRLFLIGGWPVVEQFAVYMAQNLTKTRFARHNGEDMARRWLMRNIRVELNHADYWVNWAAAHGVSLDDLQAQKVPAELHALSHWCSQTTTSESLILSMAATNYAIEGVTGEWAAVVCSSDVYAWEALEIICTLAGLQPSASLVEDLRKAICKSYDYMFLFLERCLEAEVRGQVGTAREAVPA
jgi:pyrroloquinoline quinone (PQQ) biosynthesis protein C